MTPMQEKFEKEFNRKECLNAGGGWYHDAAKAFIGRAEIESKMEMLKKLEAEGLINKNTYDGGEGISIYHKFKNRLKAELKGETGVIDNLKIYKGSGPANFKDEIEKRDRAYKAKGET